MITSLELFQHTAARRRLGHQPTFPTVDRSFNTQPPEGGWDELRAKSAAATVFQHTAARRRLGKNIIGRYGKAVVSTHSRPKAAGNIS